MSHLPKVKTGTVQATGEGLAFSHWGGTGRAEVGGVTS